MHEISVFIFHISIFYNYFPLQKKYLIHFLKKKLRLVFKKKRKKMRLILMNGKTK